MGATRSTHSSRSTEPASGAPTTTPRRATTWPQVGMNGRLRQIEGRGSADYLWNVKNVVPFLKVDKGLADEVDGAQVMKPMPGLDALLARAVEKGVFGTKDALGDQGR